MPAQPRPLPDALGDAFRTAHARAAGVTEGRLRAKDLERPFHGVRLRPERPGAVNDLVRDLAPWRGTLTPLAARCLPGVSPHARGYRQTLTRTARRNRTRRPIGPTRDQVPGAPSVAATARIGVGPVRPFDDIESW